MHTCSTVLLNSLLAGIMCRRHSHHMVLADEAIPFTRPLGVQKIWIVYALLCSPARTQG